VAPPTGQLSARRFVSGDDLSVTDLRSVTATSGEAGYDRHAASYDHNTGHFNDFRERAVSALRLRPAIPSLTWAAEPACVFLGFRTTLAHRGN
jgi:hypothetical protein